MAGVARQAGTADRESVKFFDGGDRRCNGDHVDYVVEGHLHDTHDKHLAAVLVRQRAGWFNETGGSGALGLTIPPSLLLRADQIIE